MNGSAVGDGIFFFALEQFKRGSWKMEKINKNKDMLAGGGGGLSVRSV